MIRVRALPVASADKERISNWWFVSPALLICIYVLLYPPFVVGSLLESIAPTVRLLVEASVLGLLGIFAARRSIRWIYPLMLVAAILVLLNHAAGTDLRNALSLLAKVIFALLLFSACSADEKLRLTLNRCWIAFIAYTTLSAVAGWIGHYLHFPNFSYVENRIDLGYGFYDYYNNPLFGNLMLKTHSAGGQTYSIPRFTGWVVEPGQLSLLFALTLSGAEILAPSHYGRRLIAFSCILGGILTLSAAFIVALAAIAGFYVFHWLRRTRTSLWWLVSTFVPVLVILVALAAANLIDLKTIGSWSSLENRIERVLNATALWREPGFGDLLFGSGVGAIARLTSESASSGLVVSVLEKGLLYTAFLIALVMFINRQLKVWLIFVVYLLSFDFWSWPSFWVGLVLVSLPFHSRRDANLVSIASD